MQGSVKLILSLPMTTKVHFDKFVSTILWQCTWVEFTTFPLGHLEQKWINWMKNIPEWPNLSKNSKKGKKQQKYQIFFKNVGWSEIHFSNQILSKCRHVPSDSVKHSSAIDALLKDLWTQRCLTYLAVSFHSSSPSLSSTLSSLS